MEGTPSGVSRGQSRGAASAAKQLADWIASAQYPLHSKLPPERELADLLKLPRGQLREALKLLEDEGRIWRRVGMGTFVGGRARAVRCGPESLGAATTLAEILEARSLIEPIVARLSAQRAERVDIAMIEQYSAFANKSQTWAEWEKWDSLLHAAIAEASGNGVLINTINQLFQIKTHSPWAFSSVTKFDPALVARYAAEHAELIACIARGDGEGAEAAMQRHMLGVRMTTGPTISNARRLETTSRGSLKIA
jgi:DNA-binding FadR family transcriptional regulator